MDGANIFDHTFKYIFALSEFTIERWSGGGDPNLLIDRRWASGAAAADRAFMHVWSGGAASNLHPYLLSMELPWHFALAWGQHYRK